MDSTAFACLMFWSPFILFGRGGAASAQGLEPSPPAPSLFTKVWDLTDATVVELVLPQLEAFYRFGNADQHVVFEPRGELGLCIAALDPTPGFGAATTGPILNNPHNHYSPEGSTAFLSRNDTVSAAEQKGDNAVGLALPFSTPKKMRLQMSSLNVVDDNAGKLFSDNVSQERLVRSHFPVSQGFMGIQTGLPQDISEGFIGEGTYEAIYVRPSNGAGPGPNELNPATTVQFCADPGFEWFWLRAHAFEGDLPTSNTTKFAFEGYAETRFANENLDTMLANANALEYVFDDNDHGVNLMVNGKAAVSAVTNQNIDRSLFGSRTPSVFSGSRSAIMFEPGVYLCVQQIEWSPIEQAVV